MNIRSENAARIKEILDMIGPENASVHTQSDWVFSVYYSESDEDSLTIEMCLSSDFGGDPLFDPLMRIRLTKDADGNYTEAIPLYYLSQTPFYTEEIYSEDNPSCYDPALTKKADELDSRLAEWIVMLKAQGYLNGGTI